MYHADEMVLIKVTDVDGKVGFTLEDGTSCVPSHCTACYFFCDTHTILHTALGSQETVTKPPLLHLHHHS